MDVDNLKRKWIEIKGEVKETWDKLTNGLEDGLKKPKKGRQKSGQSKKKVRNSKQAMSISLSESRRKGIKVKSSSRQP